ncbi:MAG: Holliday junction branch migration protein RuvA [Candidatus Dependentiae bacterium]|nr:Holliday junction branch migration protein RuvA [Candidatus Dependentiae bacterium]
MIDFLEGEIAAVLSHQITIFVNGIGWNLAVPEGDAFRVGERMRLYTHLHWNAEQGPSLFGFVREADRTVFRLVIDCPGVGPKLALAVLRQMPGSAFVAAIMQGDIKTLSSVSGIGTRKAETLVVSLKNRATDLVEDGFELGAEASGAKNLTQVRHALESLSYDRTEVHLALEHLKGLEGIDQEPVPVMLKKALSFLARSR